jgi:hypothetical protein
MRIVDAGLLKESELSSAYWTHMAVGTGATLDAPGDTALETETVRVALSVCKATGNQLVLEAFYDATLAAGVDLTEFGVLSAASGGVMFLRGLFSATQKKAVGKEMIVTVTVVRANAS